ncbi:MAG: antitoxin YezG family protein [Flavobacteriaceae bacterium]|jgi:hypothetical protein|nr:antitoxin YezG family protein [Flavobacteriaceae bacterium]
MNAAIPDFGKHYTAIGQSLVDILPEDFQEAWAKVEMEDNVWGLEVFYLKKNGRYGYLNDGLNKLLKEFVNLENAYQKSELGFWTTATFYLTAAGKMTLDLGYEDVSDYDSIPTRRDAWIKKYLGDASLIDWPKP